MARKLAWVSHAGVHAMGRVTYEEVSGFWPTSTGEYAKPMNEIPKVVFSKTRTRADWSSSTIASGDLEDEIARLRSEPGGEVIVYGGYTFAQALTRANLADEYRLVTRPVALRRRRPHAARLALRRRDRRRPGEAVPLGLVDEFRLHKIPVLVSSGTPLFAELHEAINPQRTAMMTMPTATHLRFSLQPAPTKREPGENVARRPASLRPGAVSGVLHPPRV